jgi:hypothetical protein
MSTDFPAWYQDELNSNADDTSVRQTIANPNVTCRVDDTRMDFGGWILGEIWAKRLINKPDCWYRNGKKVSIVDLHKSWQHGR